MSRAESGQRLDTFVAGQLPRLSRAFAAKLILQGKVLVNGSPAKPGQKLRADDDIAIDYDESRLDAIPHIELPVLYEDDACLVINKPAGILTHARGAMSDEATVASFLRDRMATETAENTRKIGVMTAGAAGERAGIVHRLDRATSGVMIGAKTPDALSFLQKQFAQRRAKKTYIAIVEGAPEPIEAIIDMPIERNPKAPATFRVGANGKPSTTAYRVLRSTDTLSLVELKPATGRTHQLRVHLAHIGHPIVGDPLYGHGNYGDRMFLHAYQLEITLPGRERKTFEAPLPPEFKKLLEQ